MNAVRFALLAALALAGCVTTGPGASPVGSYPPDREPTPWPDSARVRSMELANGSVTLGLDEARIGLSVPGGALDVAFYLTPESGASYGLTGDLDGCVRRVDGPLLPGQTAGQSCGPLPAGERELRVRHDAGSAAVRVVVNATVRPCAAQPGACPGT
jgi:hypothetical protein